MTKKKIILKVLALSSAALFMAACGTPRGGPHTGTGKAATPASASTSTVIKPPAVLEHTTIKTISRHACADRQNHTPTVQFGSSMSSACMHGALSMTAYVPSPRFAGSPVAISLDDSWNAPVTAKVSSGRLVPLSPWMTQNFTSTTPFDTNPVYGYYPYTDTLVTRALAPTATIPAFSGGAMETMATWLWYPPASAATLTITGMTPITISAAHPALSNTQVTPQIAASVTMGLSLEAPGSTVAAAAAWIKAHGETGTVSATTSGNAAVSPPVGVSHSETLAGTTYTWTHPRVGQTVTLTDHIQHVLMQRYNVGPASFTGYIGLLTGLDLLWHQGPASVLITPQGQTSSRLTITAPSRVRVGQSVVAITALTQNGSPVPGQSISITAGSLTPLRVTTDNSGTAAVKFRALAPARSVITATSASGLVASTVVTVVRPFPWWLLVIIIAACLAIITETGRRVRKHRKFSATTDPDGSLSDPEPTDTLAPAFAEIDEVPDAE